jgi:hypothetical protein
MSAQSIDKIDIANICNKIDEFMICEGNYFRNIIDYDIDGTLDYKKLDLIIWLKDILDRTEDCEKVLLTINKILMK